MLVIISRYHKPRSVHFLKTFSSKGFRIRHRFLSSSSPQVIFSGIQPTGVPHIGNYLGALQEWVRIQNKAPASTLLFFCIVDFHALTVNQPAAQLKKWKRQLLATLLAIGLDPKRSAIFYQSSVPAHVELMWILSCTSSVGYLSRMTQWKNKLGISDEASMLDPEAKAKLKLGLFTYPVLQAADILLYRTTHVPVGQDQAQHIEFARECAGNFNAINGEILVKPETIISPTKRVMSLKEPHLKMSKSHMDDRSRILISDKPEEIGMKVRLALTDSINGVSYDPLVRLGVSNLLDVMTSFSGQDETPQELAQVLNSLSMREFKDKVATTISSRLLGIRARYEDFMREENAPFLEEVAVTGAKKARETADVTMAAVRQAVGL